MKKTIKFFTKMTISSLISILLSLSFAFPQSDIPVVDVSQKVYDFADLFNASEEEMLYNRINSFIEMQNLDMVIVTINSNSKDSARAYADDFYDYNNFGKGTKCDGILFLIDMDNG
jgi:uncharacterized protein